MTQDEIIEMAREAGLIHILDEHAHEYGSGTFENTPYPELEAFANLVAAKEREACAQEALKLALDALETELSIDWTNNDEFNASAEKMHEAIAAIKKALEQTQEPAGWEVGVVDGVVTRRLAPPQRTWVNLTHTQMQDVYFAVLEEHRGGHQMEGQLAFGEALQAKLKEKNCD